MSTDLTGCGTDALSGLFATRLPHKRVRESRMFPEEKGGGMAGDKSRGRIIFHVDVNSAFLSWSAVKRLKEDPRAVDLRTIPSAVGGDVKTRHGIITAKSIPAKKYGVTTGEPVVSALRKCPDLVLIPSDFAFYRECSHAFIDILKKFSDQVEQVSIDEAYMDMTGREAAFSAEIAAGERFPECAAARIRQEIREKLGFTVNVGISHNKLLAKMASDFAKPDRTHTLYPEEVPAKMWPLPIGELYGCGRQTADKLTTMGIRTIGDAAAADPDILKSILGDKAGESIHRKANGIGSSTVRVEREKAKSYSHETTTSEDITGENFDHLVPPMIAHMADKVAARMQRDGVRAGTVFVVVKTGAFKRHTRQRGLAVPTCEASVISETGLQLLRDLLLGDGGLFARGETLRLLGVGGSNLEEGEYRQLDLFSWASQQKMETGERKEGSDVPAAKREEAKHDVRKVRQGDTAAAPAKETGDSAKTASQGGKAAEQDEANEKRRRLEEMMTRVQKRYGNAVLQKGMSRSGDKEKKDPSAGHER